MTLQQAAEGLRQGNVVKLRPRGNSMVPWIRSGQLVTLEPADDTQVGDRVLCKVKGRYLLHYVGGESTRGANRETIFRIQNAAGKVNGWCPQRNIYGRVVKVEN